MFQKFINEAKKKLEKKNMNWTKNVVLRNPFYAMN